MPPARVSAAQITRHLTQVKCCIRNGAETPAVSSTFSYEPEPPAGELAAEEGLSAAAGMTYGVLLGVLCWSTLLFWLGR